MNLAEMKSELRELIAELKNTETYPEDCAGWDGDTQQRWDKKNQRLDELRTGIQRAGLNDIDVELEQPQDRTEPRVRDEASGIQWPAALPEYRNLETGERLECCNRDHPSPMYDGRYSFANAIKAKILGETSHFNSFEQRAPFDTTNAIVPEDWQRAWHEKLRKVDALISAGATMLNIGGKNLNMTRVTAIPTIAAVAELVAAPVAEGTTAPFVATPARFPSLQEASREAVADSDQMAPMMESIASQSIAEGIDNAGLHGSGGLVTGLENEVGIQTLSTGAAITWARISADIGVLLSANTRIENLALVMNPADYAVLDAEQASTAGSWLGPSNWASQIRHVVSTSCDAGKFFIGDFMNHCQMVMRSTTVDWFLSGTGTATNYVTQHASVLAVTTRADVTYSQPSAFGLGVIGP